MSPGFLSFAGTTKQVHFVDFNASNQQFLVETNLTGTIVLFWTKMAITDPLALYDPKDAKVIQEVIRKKKETGEGYESLFREYPIVKTIRLGEFSPSMYISSTLL